MNRRERRQAKRAWVKGVQNDPRLSPEVKRYAKTFAKNAFAGNDGHLYVEIDESKGPVR